MFVKGNRKCNATRQMSPLHSVKQMCIYFLAPSAMYTKNAVFLDYVPLFYVSMTFPRRVLREGVSRAWKEI